MNRNPLARFLIRWLGCGLGLWIAAAFSRHITYGGHFYVIVIAGLVLAIINTIVKPILIVFTLPAILLTLGLFIILINGLTVYITSKVYPSLQVQTFGSAVIAGIVVGLVNHLITAGTEIDSTAANKRQ